MAASCWAALAQKLPSAPVESEAVTPSGPSRRTRAPVQAAPPGFSTRPRTQAGRGVQLAMAQNPPLRGSRRGSAVSWKLPPSASGRFHCPCMSSRYADAPPSAPNTGGVLALPSATWVLAGKLPAPTFSRYSTAAACSSSPPAPARSAWPGR